MSDPQQEQTLLFFPNVVLRREFGDLDLNQRLYAWVNEIRSDPAVDNFAGTGANATVGGFQPDITLHERFAGHPVWEAFLSEIVHPSVQRYMGVHQRVAAWPRHGAQYHFIGSWAVLYPQGAYQEPHMHREASCVFTYYARVPERPRPEGGITFINPCVESTYPRFESADYQQRLFPRNGTCAIFPGWLQHYTHPHFSDADRLMFSLDVRFETPAEKNGA